MNNFLHNFNTDSGIFDKCLYFSYLNIFSHQIFNEVFLKTNLLDSSVGTEKGYGLEGRGSIPGSGKKFVLHSIQTGYGARLASCLKGYRELFPRRYSGRVVQLTTHLYLVPMSRMVELYLHSPACLHGVVLN
jgi:hypothetical protein